MNQIDWIRGGPYLHPNCILATIGEMKGITVDVIITPEGENDDRVWSTEGRGWEY